MFYFHTKPLDYIKYFAFTIALSPFCDVNCVRLEKKTTEQSINRNQIEIPWKKSRNCVVGGWEFKGIMTDSQNESFTLRDLLGNVVVLIFSTTWCPNCPDAVRKMDSLNNRLKNIGIKNVRVIHINMGEESQREVQEHLDDLDVSLEAYKSISSHLSGVSVIPSVLVVNKKGKPVCGYIGGGFDYLSDEFVKFIIALARQQ